MNTQYAFSFDARFCSGCKACQAACKDKNSLPTGVLWRRVIEVSGGTWQENGAAWTNTVFAYNLSISCMHCTHPKCAGVCPTKAYTIRDDGIVFLDRTKCAGCGYCAWACAYGAPQYNTEIGQMTKCDFCLENLEQGLPPACVAACPLRVLDYGEMASLPGQQLWNVRAAIHPFPLPAYSHSQPRLAITPHPAMERSEMKSVANLEEIQPRPQSNWEELPLMLFTLLTQMAVGGVWAMMWMFSLLWSLVEFDSTWLRLLPSLSVGTSLGVGMLASFAHLGTKKNAWRMLSHWRKSSLSREILFAILFGCGWLFTALEILIWHQSTFEWIAMTAVVGIGLIYNMSQVYRIPAATGWNTWRTNASFLVSSLLLGISFMAPILAYESNLTGIHIPSVQWITIAGSLLILLLAELLMINRKSLKNFLILIRIELIVVSILIIASGLLFSTLHLTLTSVLLFLIILCEEAIGKWVFYASRLSCED